MMMMTMIQEDELKEVKGAHFDEESLLKNLEILFFIYSFILMLSC